MRFCLILVAGADTQPQCSWVRVRVNLTWCQLTVVAGTDCRFCVRTVIVDVETDY